MAFSLRQTVASWLAPALPWFGSRVAGSGMPGDPLNACGIGWESARALAAVERCCMLYANGLLLPRSVVDRPATGGQQPVTGTDAARALTDLPADDLMICGYSAALIGFGTLKISRNARGGPQSLSFIAPWRVSIERSASGPDRYVRIAADPALGEPEAVLPVGDVVFIRWRPSPQNPALAESPINSIAPAISAAIRIRDTQASLLRAASLPSLVLETDRELQPDQMKMLRREWEERYAGLGSTAIVGWGLKARTMPVGSSVDLQLSEAFRDYQAEIGRAWGVPTVLLNEPGDNAYNSAIAASRGFVLHSLKPWLTRTEDELSRKLLSPAERMAGRRVVFDSESLTVEPGLETADYLTRLVEAGILTIDEARNRLNYPDIREKEAKV